MMIQAIQPIPNSRTNRALKVHPKHQVPNSPFGLNTISGLNNISFGHKIQSLNFATPVSKAYAPSGQRLNYLA